MTPPRATLRTGPVVAPAVLAARPFLKWAGGKRQLLPTLRAFYPRDFGSYFEPFVGSGAVFFDLSSQDRLATRPAVLSDVNRDVIGCYQALRENVTAVIAALTRLARGHDRGGSAHYYAIRDGRFNPLRAQLPSPDGPAGWPEPYPPELAAMLIYLNRTGFNGLFRLNRTGGFNVPAGRYAKPAICDAANLNAVADLLRRPGLELGLAPFERAVERAVAGDFLYFDPPYAPVSPTARFTAYTAGGFSAEDQARLQETVLGLVERGCFVLLSNSDTAAVDALYTHSRAVRHAGLRVYRVSARRAINARGSGRGPVGEVIVTNVLPAGAEGAKWPVHSV
ncbi:MAG: DNA adenine methylase [Vicinamibacterales bacterium]